MDVVKSVVERLGGTVRVQSELDKGTSITLNLPLSLALLRVVLLEAGEELFALPDRRRPPHPSGRRRRHRPAAAGACRRSRWRKYSADAALDDAACAGGAAGARARPSSWPRASDGRFGILVDAVHEEQELVFKELRGPLRNQQTFTGAALLGNGDIVPILDVNALFELASRGPSVAAAPAMTRRAAPRVCRVLVVDDSLVAGELQKNILLAAGYESEIASDGVEALECLHQQGVGPRRRRRRHAADERIRADRAHPRRRAVPRYPGHHRHLARHGRRSPPRIRSRAPTPTC